MKRNLIFSITFFFFLFITSCTMPTGQQYGDTAQNGDTVQNDSPSMTPTGQSCGNAWKLPLAEIEGEIKRQYYSTPPGTAKRGLHLDVVDNASGKHIIIHVFSEECIKKSPERFKFEIGQFVTVSGSEFFTENGTQLNICAAEISTLNNLLRNKNDGAVNKSLCTDKPECPKICRNKCQHARNPKKCLEQCMRGCKKR